MEIQVAHVTIWMAGSYAAIGVLVGLPFIAFGLGRIDPAAKAAPWTFRLLVLPGAIAMWPWLLRRWLTARRTT